MLAFYSVLPWKVFRHRLGRAIARDNIFGRSAELAYFFLFSVFPLLLFLSNLLGMISGGERIEQDLLHYFKTVMPLAAYRLVASTLKEVTRTSGGGKLSAGILISLAIASSGMVAIIEGLNTAYAVREARSWWKRRLVAGILTLAMAVFTILALTIMLYGNALGQWIAGNLGWGAAFTRLWPFVQWPLTLTFALVAFTVVYRYAPNLHEQKWHWIIPGASVALVLWLLESLGLRVYLRFFDTSDATYGSLGALMVLMMWLYLFGIAILIGGAVNSIIEQAAARAGDPDAKLPGEKTPGELRS